VAGIILVALLAACTGPPSASVEPTTVTAPRVTVGSEPSSAPSAVPTIASTPAAIVVSKACADAFAAAAAVDDLHDAVEDLNPAVLACMTLAEWTAASIAHPGAISEGVDPAEFLRNRCAAGGELASSALCKSVEPSVAPDTAAIVATLCASPAYAGCSSGAALFVEAMDPGTFLAVCDYGDGTGDVVVIDSGTEADAEAQCSGGGLISPSKVVRVVRLP
jgi:hypothetical protein